MMPKPMLFTDQSSGDNQLPIIDLPEVNMESKQAESILSTEAAVVPLVIYCDNLSREDPKPLLFEQASTIELRGASEYDIYGKLE